MSRPFGLSTVAVHGSPHRKPDWAPVVGGLFQSSTFVNPVGSEEEVIYPRYGNNPNQVAVAEKYARLEGADAAIFVGSGMGATALALLAVLRPGDHMVASEWIYGGVRQLFQEEFPRLGIGVSFVNPGRTREWRQAITPQTRAIFVEAVTNPVMRVVDLGPIAMVARAEGIALVVDSTFASPINFRPLEHGADIVITSATKYLNGHDDVVAGAIAGTATLVDEATRLLQMWGQAIDPHTAWLIDRGMRTLAVRMARHNENGMAVARWAETHPRIRKVHYPGLPSHADYAVAARTLAGFGGMVGIELDGGIPAAEAMLRKVRIIAHAPSLGGVESLASEPRLTSHKMIGAAGRALLGIPDGFIRLSCGIEDADDLIADLAQALGD